MIIIINYNWVVTRWQWLFYMYKNTKLVTNELKKICPASFRETCQWIKFPLNWLRAQSRVSPAVGLLSSASGPAYLGMHA